MSNSALHMWSYWRDKKGAVEAMEEQYPELLNITPDLQQAISQIKNAERAIDKLMSDLEEINEDE